MWNALRDFLLNLLISGLNGFESMVTSAQNVLTGGAFDMNTIWNRVLGELTDELKPFCYVIIGICCLIELAQVASKVDLVKWEHGLKIGVKMALAKVCIDTAPKFLNACFSQASEWIMAIMDNSDYENLGDLVSGPVQDQLAHISGAAILGLFVAMLILILAIWICGILIQVVAYGRMFEIYVYLAVSPLPCAFFPLGDGSGGGFSRITQRFFKSFIAVCLQGVMMLICIRLFYMIVGTTFKTMLEAAAVGAEPFTVILNLCFTMLMIAIVLVMSIFRCGSWAKGIIDAM